MLRNDTGVYEGAEISIYYDPMIAKLCAHAQTREAAIDLSVRALDEFEIDGIQHNVPFLAALLDHPRFRRGTITTGFIAEEFPDGFHGAQLAEPAYHSLVALAAFLKVHEVARAQTISGQLAGRGRRVANEYVVFDGTRSLNVAIRQSATAFDVVVDGHVVAIAAPGFEPGRRLFKGLINGKPFSARLRRVGSAWQLTHRGATFNFKVRAPRAAALAAFMPVKAPPDTSKYLLCPMPGLVVSINVEVGQEIKAGETLAIVEAMKMENVLKAERDGVISIINAKAGDSLAVDAVILEFA
jgi:propionyl-CoA carboxylase alpha chain